MQKRQKKKRHSRPSLQQEPSISAETAVLIDAVSGKVLYDRRMGRSYVSRQHDENSDRHAGRRRSGSGGNRHRVGKRCRTGRLLIYLTAGEKITMKDLLYGMMLRSGNDAATAVAEAIAGDTETFAELMNERTASLGLKNSHFVNPSGLQDENHYSSAYDLAMITRQALQNDLFRKIVSSKTYQAERKGADAYKYFYNKNKTIFQYEGATGVKIGYTTAAGRCLVASAERNGTELIAVVLNDHDWFEDAYRLLDYGFEAFERVVIARQRRR